MGINPLFQGGSGAAYGGFQLPQPKPENQTVQYLDLLTRAAGDDKKLSQDELQTEIDTLTGQQSLIEQSLDAFGDMFGGYLKNVFQAIKQQVDVRLTVANSVKDNFDLFDAADEDDDLVSRQDMIDLAREDGNVYDISHRDLGLPVETPTESKYYYQFFQGADRDGGYFPGMPDRNLTSDEITDHIDRLEEQKESLEEMKDLYPGTYGAYINYQIDEIQRLINAGNRMNTNFDSLDAANSDNETDGDIGIYELYRATRRDDNPADLSDEDLVRPPIEE